MITITAFYAALLALLFVALSRNVILLRRSRQIAIGAESDPDLLRRVRAQGNFAEYTPFAIILMAFAESQGLPSLPLHGLGLALLIGRSLHAFGLSRSPEDFRFRVSGMGLTLSVVMAGAIANLVLATPLLVAGF